MSTADDARALVVGFYTEGLIGRQPRQAFERCMAEDFVEHKRDVPAGTRAAVIAFLEDLMARLPEAKWQLLRVVAQDDLVALHASFTPAPGAPAYAIADFFRVEDGKIVEHWDVVASPAAKRTGGGIRE